MPVKLVLFVSLEKNVLLLAKQGMLRDGILRFLYSFEQTKPEHSINFELM